MRATVQERARVIRTAFVLTLSVLLLGCETLGPNALRSGRNQYNEAINNTDMEQLLLNIVRLRHTDTAYFLQIATITSRAEIGAAVGAQGGNALATLKYSEKPSIVYIPLTGESFVRQLLTRVDLQTLSLVAGAGWARP